MRSAIFLTSALGSVAVLIDVNAKAKFEAGYWRGVLDSQGKVDGGYY